MPGAGDVADDVAIWVHPTEPSASLILATDKGFGLRVYDLQGNERQAIAAGRLNNVDLRPLPGSSVFTHLAAASNRSQGSISLFGIRPDGRLEWLQGREINTGLEAPYGLCMHAAGEHLQVFVNDTDGHFQQWQVSAVQPARLLRTFRVHDQPEGCVVDDLHGTLFLGVEDRGVYRVPVDPRSTAPPAPLAGVDHVVLFDDVEGMSLYARDDGTGYLVVSSQGSSRYAVYDRRAPHELLAVLKIVDHPAGKVDGVSDTDGLDISHQALGPAFPQGLMVVQDGFNSLPQAHQNFKLVDWRDVAAALAVATGHRDSGGRSASEHE